MEELNNRQIYSKKDNDYDEWNVAQNKFSNYNFNKPNDDMDVREEINYEQEDNKFLDVKPRKVYKEGNAKHNEFELDWDEDESYSYLKMLNNENTKENINKYGVQNQLLIKQSKQTNNAYNPPPPPQKPRKEERRKDEAKGEKLKKNYKTERTGERHFKSVAPQIDDWDE